MLSKPQAQRQGQRNGACAELSEGAFSKLPQLQTSWQRQWNGACTQLQQVHLETDKHKHTHKHTHQERANEVQHEMRHPHETHLAVIIVVIRLMPNSLVCTSATSRHSAFHTTGADTNVNAMAVVPLVASAATSRNYPASTALCLFLVQSTKRLDNSIVASWWAKTERHSGNRWVAFSSKTIAVQLLRGLQHFLRVRGALWAALGQGHSVEHPRSRRF